MWGLFAHASRTEIEQAVHRSYQNYGLTGQFEVDTRKTIQAWEDL